MLEKTHKNELVDMSFFKDALELIEKSKYILLLTHINPDPDTLSSALALSNFFEENKIKHKVYNCNKDLPKKLDFLHGFSKITSQEPKFYDLAICVDCASKQRFELELRQNIPIINIDHHKSNPNFGDINIINSQKSSTAELVYDFFRYNGLYISKNSASAMYVGIYDDSLAFTNARCDEFTFEKINFLVKCGAEPSFIANRLTKRDSLAKYRLLPKVLESLELHNEGKLALIYLKQSWLKSSGAKPRDAEVALNMITNIGIVKIAVFFRMLKDECRISIRSKSGIDVSKICAKFGGGGHANAGGFSMVIKDLEETKEEVLKEIYEEEF